MNLLKGAALIFLGITMPMYSLFAADNTPIKINISSSSGPQVGVAFPLNITIDVTGKWSDCTINGQSIDVSNLSFAYDKTVFSPAPSNTAMQASSCQSNGETFHLTYQTSTSFLSNKEGKISFWPAELKFGGKIYKSQTISLDIAKNDGKIVQQEQNNSLNRKLPSIPNQDNFSKENSANNNLQFSEPMQLLLWIQELYLSIKSFEDWYLVALLLLVLLVGYRYAAWLSPKPSYQEKKTIKEKEKQGEINPNALRFDASLALPNIEDSEFSTKISFLLRRHLLPFNSEANNLTWSECLAYEPDGERKMLLLELVPLLEKELYRQSSLQSRQNIYTLAKRILFL